MYELVHEARFLQSAHKVAEGIMQFRWSGGALLFPGDSISRLSCSYGNGSAGIALFLNRLLGEKVILSCSTASSEGVKPAVVI